MRSIFYLICGLLLSAQLAEGQVNKHGYPLSLKYFEPDELNGAEQNWALTQDERGIIYVGSNDRGILKYDGVDWETIMIPNNAAVRTLKRASDGTIYVGAHGDFGYLRPNSQSSLEYHSLLSKVDSSVDEINPIYSLIEWNQKIYFCGYGAIHEYDPDNKFIRSFDLEDYNIPYGRLCFEVHGRFFIYDPSAGIFEFNGEAFAILPGSDFFIRKFVLSILPYSDSEILVITHRDGAFAFNLSEGTVEMDPLPDKANNFIKVNRFYRAVRLPDGNYVMGTLDGGLIITDTEGAHWEIINKETGLGNEVITSIYINQENPGVAQLWLTLNIGLAKVEYFSPFRYFSEMQGLEGGINDIVEYGNTIFVATRAGVFYLSEDDRGFARFSQVEGIEAQCWSLLVFSHPGSSDTILWAGTEPDGIYEIDRDFQARNIRDQNPSIGKNLETFKLYHNSYRPNMVFAGTGGALNVITFIDGEWEHVAELRDMSDAIRSISMDQEGRIWVGTNLKGIGMFDFSNPGDTIVEKYGIDRGLTEMHTCIVQLINGDLYSATPDGLFKYVEEGDQFVPDTLFGAAFAGGNGIEIYKVVPTRDGEFYLSIREHSGRDITNQTIRLIPDDNGQYTAISKPFRRLPSRSTEAIHLSGENIAWLGVSDFLFTYDPDFERNYDETFETLVLSVSTGQDSLIFSGTYFTRNEAGDLRILNSQPDDFIPSLKYSQNSLSFEWGCPYFDAQDQLQYSFRLVGFEDQWSKWTDRTEFPYTNLPHGDLVFEVKARNVYGVESGLARYKFSILPPWYQTIWAYILYVILAFFLVVMIVRLYTRRLQNEKIRLEGIVAHRTAEVVRQKEELEDSITYASRIQRAILPSERVLNEQLPEHFIMFKPRDIVSGDFYWMTQKDGQTIIVAADCTGHGVPGAFMSLLGMSFLNEIVSRSERLKSDEILNLLRAEIMSSLKQTGKEDEAKDGIDLALVIFDREHMKLQYSGAYNPLMLVRPLTEQERKKIREGADLGFPPRSIHDEDHVLIQINADKMPIGISAKELKPFTLHELDIKKGYSIYLSSDGYVDQFGGMDGKKFMSRGFKKMILDVQDQPIKKQGQLLSERFDQWRGDLPQVDDILVIGIRFD
jgi:serine phosphatase RsbU (regulator of sigma subunit)/ligand-binding sensor domain-containing protein